MIQNDQELQETIAELASLQAYISTMENGNQHQYFPAPLKEYCFQERNWLESRILEYQNRKVCYQ